LTNTAAHPKCQSLTAIIIEDELELLAPFLSINRHQESSTKREDIESKM